MRTDIKKEIVKNIPWVVLLLIFASYVAGVFVANLGIKLPFWIHRQYKKNIKKPEKIVTIVLWSCFLALSLFYMGYEMGKDFYSMIH